MWRVFTTFALAAHVAHAVCYCPRICLPTHEDDCWLRERSSCNDMEARYECDAANDEVTDAVNSLGRNADLFLTSAVFNGSLSAAGASELSTKLAIAIESDKPVADCETGLTTDTRVVNTSSLCFSPELLTQCATLRDGIDAWALQLRGKLANTTAGVDADSAVVTAFVAAMGDRSDATTANIRCAAYEAELVDNGGFAVVPGIALSLIAMMAALL